MKLELLEVTKAKVEFEVWNERCFSLSWFVEHVTRAVHAQGTL